MFLSNKKALPGRAFFSESPPQVVGKMNWLKVADSVLFFLLLGTCLFTDLRERKIYNSVLVGAFCLGLLLHGLTEGGAGLVASGKGLVLGLFLLLPFFLLGGIGGGDVKFLAVIGALRGPEFVFRTFLIAAVAGAVLSLGLAFFRGRLGLVLRHTAARIKTFFFTFNLAAVTPAAEEEGEEEGTPVIPYAVAITVGAIAAWILG
ncbi:MAG: prepilin peptidase CpaA [Eubacteriales bacterium]|nr:prepilin peptidase CpaA [Eubacteriales bacterium]